MSVFVRRLLFFLRIGSNPDEAIAKAVEYYVAVSSLGLRLEVVPGKGREEAAALLVVIDHHVFAGCQCLRVKILNSDTIGSWFVSRVDSKLARRHLLPLSLILDGADVRKRRCIFP